MENFQQQPKENNQVAQNNGLPTVYTGASQAQTLTERERNELSSRFKDEEYEIRPDGFIYIPQALIRQRLNSVIGATEWAMLLAKDWDEPIGEKQVKVYYDGALYIRGCFVARSTGEGSYYKDNSNSSQASAKEAAKSDCIVRCVKDLGLGLEIYMPSFIREWQKKFAIKVFIDKNGKKETAWRRKDVEPFWNETGPVPSYIPGVATETQQNSQPNKQLPWLNHGPEYDIVLRKLHNLETTLPQLFTEYRIAKKTEEAIKTVLIKEWKETVANKSSIAELTELYNGDETWLKAHPFIIEEVFKPRRAELKKVAA